MAPGIAVAPWIDESLIAAIEESGGRMVDPSDADALVWLNPLGPQDLIAVLENSPAKWVQLPFAGIESFFEAGAIDPNRTWTCAKGIYGHACAEHALTLMLAAARRIHHHARNRAWETGGLGRPERRLKGSTVVVFGTGGIGRALVPMVHPLGASVIGVNRSGRPLDGAHKTVTADGFQ